MMVKKGILLIMLIIASVSMGNSGKEEMERDAKSDMTAGDYCGMDEFEELNYYLFCDSQLHEGAGGFTFRPSIIGSETKTIEEAKQLYQEFMERLPLDSVEEGEENNAFYVSPDCKWVITNKWYEHKTRSTQMLFYEKEKVREKENDRWAVYPILIVKDGNSYREMDKEQYEKLLEMEKITFYDGGYDCFNKINIEGNLFAEIRDEYNLLTIRDIEEGAEQWSFSLQGIQEEVARIRDDIKEGDTVLVTIQQFEGDEKEGWLTVQAGLSSFFRIAYPSGEVTYLGEYMYSVCFSPDGKYVAYSSDADYDDKVDMEQEEYERMKKICPSGICVREIETGKTAYLYWDPAKNPEENYMEYRHFMWIEKEGFEEYMAGSRENTQDTPSKDTEISDAITIEENPYFFNDDRVYLEAKAKYDNGIDSKFVEEFVCAEMRFIKQYEQGSVYKLVIEPLGALTDERLNIYFYVTNSKIYRLWSYVYQDDITFYDDDELLVKVLDTDEKLINNGQIVCQNEKMQCELKEGDSEFHFAITKQGKQIQYSSYTITPNGEVYYYENFIWEEGKGLIEFGSGYRAERDPLYLTEITQISAREYKRRLYMLKPSIGDHIY